MYDADKTVCGSLKKDIAVNGLFRRYSVASGLPKRVSCASISSRVFVLRSHLPPFGASEGMSEPL